MNALKQIESVTLMNMSNVPTRWRGSLVTIIGIASVVAVLISMLAMSLGIRAAARTTGEADRAIVLVKGASAETLGVLTRAATRTIENSGAVRRDAADVPIASSEVVRLLSMPRRSDGLAVNVMVRGVGPQAALLRPEWKLLEGRMFTRGLNEVIVGKSAQRQYRNTQIGDSIVMDATTWSVVGIFTSGGDSHDSELVTDAETLMSADGSSSFNSVTVRLKSADEFVSFAQELEADPTLSVEVERERDYFANQSKTIGTMFAIFAYLVGGIMGVGALFGALNTMYAAVSSRAREIAILRAIGFGSTSIVISVLLEAMLLAVIGGAFGAVIAWLAFDGYTTSTAPGDEFGELIFDLVVNADVALSGLIFGCVIGLIGGLLPAVRAARSSVIEALRSS